MTTIILAIILMGIVMLGMAIGVILRGKSLHGHCGGEVVIGPDGKRIRCDTCPNRDEDE